MRDVSTSTIAQILYTDYPVPGFAALVGGMEQAVATLQSQTCRLDWSEDDIVIFDCDGCRIVLGIAEATGSGHRACLTVAVGPSPQPVRPDAPPLRPHYLCSALVERIVREHPCDAVLWTEAEGVVASDLVDLLVDALPSGAEIRDLTCPAAIVPGLAARAPAKRAAGPERAPCEIEQARLREAFYPRRKRLPDWAAALHPKLADFAADTSHRARMIPFGAAMMAAALVWTKTGG